MLYVLAWQQSEQLVTHLSQWDDADDAAEAYLVAVHDRPDQEVVLIAAFDHDHLRRMYPDLRGLPETTSPDPNRRLVLDPDGGLTQVQREPDAR